MDLRLDGQRVLITGGSKGIGLACAHAFLKEGAKVAIASRDAGNLAAAQAELHKAGYEVYTETADLGDALAAQKLVESIENALGPVDVLVNSAGAAKRYPPAELRPESWRAAMDAKFFTYINAMDAVLRGMVERGAGSIVNIVGVGGRVASPTHLPGGSANAALMLASAGLANAWGSKGVRINAINPGATLTGRVQGSVDAEASRTGKPPAQVLKEMQGRIPLGRLADPAEVADARNTATSARASYVTGALITMDGGVHPLGA